MPFTFQALADDNSVDTAEISITLDPATAVFAATDWVGGSNSTEEVNVANDNAEVPITYYVSADWYAADGDTAQNARLLAERLNITVTADPDGTSAELYDGVLAGLIQQPVAGRPLAADEDEEVKFELSLPTEAATDLIQDMGIEFDLVFVAVTA